jgi:hypothetical protein
MKKLILTFDYELFLNKSGSIENCLLNPVKKLRKTLIDNNINAVFFIDVLYLWRLKKDGLSASFKVVKENIQSLILDGHDIELHLHPHWIDAKYDKNTDTWDLKDARNYRFNKLSSDNQAKLFALGFETLKSIGLEAHKDFKITSFRAGGLCLQPFEDYLPYLKKHEINIDSSVAPGMISGSETHYYNYQTAPHKGIYNFQDNPIKENTCGAFKEFPILHYKKTIFDKIWLKLKSENQTHTIFGDGLPASPKATKTKKTLLSKLQSDKYLFSFDGDFSQSLITRKLRKHKESVITILCHPKLLSEASLKLISELQQKQEFEFHTFHTI